MDRIGDTFRFKAENVSTTQVEGVINKITHIHDVIVYGVKVPHTDGSVGMAVIADPQNVLDLKRLAEEVSKELPNYSRPRFLRITDSIQGTSKFSVRFHFRSSIAHCFVFTVTQKLKKTDFKKDAYDLKRVGNDKVYVLNENKFEPLTPEVVSRINSGEFSM